MRKNLISVGLICSLIVVSVEAGQVTSVFNPGDQLTAESLRSIKSAVNNNDARLNSARSMVRIIMGSTDTGQIFNGNGTYPFTVIKFAQSTGIGFYGNGGTTDTTYINGRFTAPNAGFYRVSASADFAQTTQIIGSQVAMESRVYQSNAEADADTASYDINKAGPLLGTFFFQTSTAMYPRINGSAIFYLNANNVLELGIRGSFSTLNLRGDARSNYLMIEELL